LKSAALEWHSRFFLKPDDVVLSFIPVDFIYNTKKSDYMIKFKTSFTLGFSLEHKRQVTETKVTRSISKLVVVAKEIAKKRLLKS